MTKLSMLHPIRLERNAMMDLSPDEIRFLRACDPLWFDLDPETISTILSSAYRLLSELAPACDADLLLVGDGAEAWA
jgi:hypothetical protein